jgi:16S rRNA (cytidine1402-2'-O)-methyltransferase
VNGTLYVIATPIGNLEDLSERATRLLREVRLVACEDTRHTRKLLTHIGSQAVMISYHEHNEAPRAEELLRRLKSGEDVALVSDAGTPLISDPGYRLVTLARAEGVTVVPIPGPSAVAAALSVSGLPTDRFLFVGFPPKRPAARRRQLAELTEIAATLVFYVSPHDLLGVIRDIRQTLGNRRFFLIREMTKLFETPYFGTAEEVISQLEKETPKGEYTLVVGPGEEGVETGDSETVDIAAYVEGLMACRNLSRKDAVSVAARDLGLPKRKVYRLFNAE